MMNSEEIFYLLKEGNYEERVNELTTICQKQIDEDNDPLAMNNIGFIYKRIHKDYAKAEEWYIKAANLNNSAAMTNIGSLYQHIHKDYTKAEEWYIKATNLNCTVAMNNIGYICWNFYKDDTKAEEWYIKAVCLGNADAMNNLGVLYQQTYKDYTKAEEWYIKAANLGKSTAMYNLGNLYVNIHKDYQKAYDFFIKIDKDYENYNDVIFLLNECIKKTKILNKVYGSVETDECAICRDPLINTNSSIIIQVCGHIYHNKCIKNISKCPYCSYEFCE